MSNKENIGLLEHDNNINLDDLEERRLIPKKYLIRIAIVSGIILTVVAIVLAVILTQSNEDNKNADNTDNSDKGNGEQSEEYSEIEYEYEKEKEYEKEEDKEKEKEYEKESEKESEIEKEIIEENEENDHEEEEEEIPVKVYGNITCIYDIISGEINILSDEYEVEGDDSLFIYIGNKRINFAKKYNFAIDDSKKVTFEILTQEFSMKNMFKDVIHLKEIYFSYNSYGKIISMESAFEKCFKLEIFNFEEGFDTSELISMKKAFAYCISLEKININNMNLSNVKDISYMFQGSGLIEFIPEVFDLLNVETMVSMFEGCVYLTFYNI